MALMLRFVPPVFDLPSGSPGKDENGCRSTKSRFMGEPHSCWRNRIARNTARTRNNAKWGRLRDSCPSLVKDGELGMRAAPKRTSFSITRKKLSIASMMVSSLGS